MNKEKQKNISSRLQAAKVIEQVLSGRSLADCLEPNLQPLINERDQALVQAMVYGVCRTYHKINAILSNILDKPIKAKDKIIHALLLVGIYQLMEMRIPEHAAVAETVQAVTLLKKQKNWAKGLVNAILRGFLRDKAKLLANIEHKEEALYAHPMWMIKKLKKDWPEHWQKIIDANNTHPPFTMRVNVQQGSREAYVDQLNKFGIQANTVANLPAALTLPEPVAVTSLPGFNAGRVSVQDAAPQWCAALLDLQPGMSVLDACAAPGGKLIHMLEVEPQLKQVVAVEKQANRIELIKQNLKRCDLQNKVSLVNEDLIVYSNHYDGELFDRILLDAPCSATGVIRRHPDIKLLRTVADVHALAALQWQMLQTVWPLLKPGGILLYATCSIFFEENEANIVRFLQAIQDASLITLPEQLEGLGQYGRQILPGMNGMDGFYYAKIEKKEA